MVYQFDKELEALKKSEEQYEQIYDAYGKELDDLEEHKEDWFEEDLKKELENFQKETAKREHERIVNGVKRIVGLSLLAGFCVGLDLWRRNKL